MREECITANAVERAKTIIGSLNKDTHNAITIEAMLEHSNDDPDTETKT